MATPQHPDPVPQPAWTSLPAEGLAAATAPTGPERAEGLAAATAPAITPPRWSGKKTAVAAALAIGLSSVGAVAAAATLPQGTGGAVDGHGGPGGGFGRPGQLPGHVGADPSDPAAATGTT